MNSVAGHPISGVRFKNELLYPYSSVKTAAGNSRRYPSSNAARKGKLVRPKRVTVLNLEELEMQQLLQKTEVGRQEYMEASAEHHACLKEHGLADRLPGKIYDDLQQQIGKLPITTQVCLPSGSSIMFSALSVTFCGRDCGW